MIRLGIKGKYNEVIGDAVFGDAKLNNENRLNLEKKKKDPYSPKGVIDDYTFEERSVLLKIIEKTVGFDFMHRLMTRRKYLKKSEVDESIEALYVMLNYVHALIMKGKVFYENGADKRQKYQGRVLLKVAQLLVEHVEWIAVEIEAKLVIADVNIGLVVAVQKVLSEFHGGKAFDKIVEGVTQVDGERQIVVGSWEEAGQLAPAASDDWRP